MEEVEEKFEGKKQGKITSNRIQNKNI